MLYEYLRLFKEASGTFTDLSLDNQDDSVTMTPNLQSTQYFYIAQYFPVNNLYFNLGSTVNATSANITIEYWDGNNWREAVDIMDATASSGVPFAVSGVLQFSPDRDYGWQRVSDTGDSNAPSALQTLRIFECYWLRISYSANIDAAAEIKEVSYTFTDTQELEKIDIEISNFYAAFASGKTDWINEIITASRMVLIDLKRQGIVRNRGQVLRFDDLFMPATYKTIELIYMNLGPSYADKRNEIRLLYDAALNIDRFTIDEDNDAHVDRKEIDGKVKRLVR